MSRRKVAKKGNENLIDGDSCHHSTAIAAVDWTFLPDDTMVHLFTLLNYRDRASLSSSCRKWRHLGATPCLWHSLDLRFHRFDDDTAAALASRCSNLRRLRFRCSDSADALIFLKARDLREISMDPRSKITDASLSAIAARHEMLESLQIESDSIERLSSNAIRAVAICCPRLRRLRLSGITEIGSVAINALSKNCPNLIDIGFMQCRVIDVTALGNVRSLRFLSVAESENLKWDLVSQILSKLPNLVGLDVSTTDIGKTAVSSMLLSCPSLRVLCALNCPHLEEDANFLTSSHGGKLLLSLFSDVFKGVASLLPDNSIKEGDRDLFSDWVDLKRKDKSLDEIMTWLEWILSHSLLRFAQTPGLEVTLVRMPPNPLQNNFWVSQGATLLLSLMSNSQEDVQETAATALATCLVLDYGNATIAPGRAEAVVRGGGLQLLLNLASSEREELQAQCAKAIANLSLNTNVAKSVADEGGITILTNLARSTNRAVAEEAAGGLWNLSFGDEHKGAIAEAGGIKALVDLISKFSTGGDVEGEAGALPFFRERVLEYAAGALANLAVNDKCGMEIVLAGGVHPLVMLARNCKFEGVQELVAVALANLAGHGDSKSAVEQETGVLEALVQLTHSPNEDVRKAAATALWNLSEDGRNREVIEAAGGVEVLMNLDEELRTHQ